MQKQKCSPCQIRPNFEEKELTALQHRGISQWCHFSYKTRYLHNSIQINGCELNLISDTVCIQLSCLAIYMGHCTLILIALPMPT